MKTQAPAPFMLTAAIAVLVGVLTIVELPCPVCDGIGYLPTAQGLRVESVELELISKEIVSKEVVRNIGYEEVDDNIRYTYAVNMLLTNEGTEPSQGIVRVVFYEVASASTLIIPAKVAVAAETTENIVRILSFERPFRYELASHWATVRTGGQDIPCPVSGARGRLPFFEWLRLTILQ